MTTRYDVSGVPLQGGYVAKRCPVRAQNDVVRPADPLPDSPVLARRFARGIAFENEIVAELLAAHPDAVIVDAEGVAGAEAATVAAMRQRAPLILNSRLPADHAGRRVGKPDLLVAVDGGGYRAIDVKHHMTLAPGDVAARAATLQMPHAMQDVTARKHKGDLLQLAHYQRMLEAAGYAAPDGRCGGIIGTERQIVWYDLDAAIWRTPSSTGKTKLRTTMEVYDFEFDFRLDIIAVAQMHARDGTAELLVVPARIGECETCPWRDYCRGVLEAGSGDVTLLPRVGWRERVIHIAREVRDRAALAALDVRTAQLVASSVDVRALLEACASEAPEKPVAELPGMARRKAQLARLDAAGVRTVADALELCRATAAYSGASLSSLPEQIDQARAALGSEPIYRRRGVEQITVPRADVEVDIDMENVEEGVYLWGMLVTTDGASTYEPFATWEPLTPGTQAASSTRFWTRLTELRDAAHAAGRSFKAYCYNESAENRYLRELGAIAGVADEVEAFMKSDEWVDMLQVVNEQLITGTGTGLKTIAPTAGFTWAVDAAGGGESMVKYDEAIGAETEGERTAARAWLLTYNRNDVEATLAIREWLSRATIPPITEVSPQ